MPVKSDLLRLNGRSSWQVAELLKAGVAVSLEEQTIIENHLDRSAGLLRSSNIADATEPALT